MLGFCDEIGEGRPQEAIMCSVFIQLVPNLSSAHHELISDALHAVDLFNFGDALVASTNELRQKLDPLNILRLEAFDGVFVDQLYDCARILHKRLVSTRIDLSLFVFDSGLLHLIL